MGFLAALPIPRSSRQTRILRPFVFIHLRMIAPVSPYAAHDYEKHPGIPPRDGIPLRSLAGEEQSGFSIAAVRRSVALSNFSGSIAGKRRKDALIRGGDAIASAVLHEVHGLVGQVQQFGLAVRVRRETGHAHAAGNVHVQPFGGQPHPLANQQIGRASCRERV